MTERTENQINRRDFFKALPAFFIAPFTETELSGNSGELEERVAGLEGRQFHEEVILFVHSKALENHEHRIDRLDKIVPGVQNHEGAGGEI